ncbi:ankyrin repeat-containing protein ITN1 [Dendrobium catenatum]|uniref:Ankyrin repeat-containing protein n=1 Tax=Dendrobium catenatum TaxID=906689 RepID=A0A2I0WJ88_9ASPA|nr:ankyrin repeat-containing protein ITN1 [Dendrobium catenatum]PKU75721.1 Ankyrin repeat-containing protein [Dendrobium catenatum]
MKELVSQASDWEYEEDGKMPNKDLKEDESTIDTNMPPDEESSAITSESSKGIILHSNSLKKDEDKKADEPIGDTPILIATRRGVVEMVKNILDTFPVAVEDFDSNHKNIVLLSVEHRQPQVYKEMLERKSMRESVFAMVDKDGNSALHLAAGSVGKSRPWVIPGTALQMQWEIKWYKFVKNSMEPSFFQHYNNKGQTAKEIFTASHESLVKEGGKWLTNTSQSCSVVAALIATVAFASATTVPGGVDQTSGFPILAGKPAFAVFAISALVALCFSVTSLIMFLSVLTSRYQEMDFERDLPVKLILGLTTLFMSIAAMLVAFCAGHFFVMEDRLKYGAFPIYIATCLPVTFFVASQFPLYVDLVSAIIADVPERTYKSLTL